MSGIINVWNYNEILDEWILQGTSDYKETYNELKYFRVIRDGQKIYYKKSQDYFEHNKYNIEQLSYNDKNPLLYTNIHNVIINN